MTALPEQPSLIDVPPIDDAPEPEKTAPVRVKVGAARESEGARNLYFQRYGQPYRDNPKDVVVWKSLRAKHSVEEIEERWRIALAASGWTHCDNIWQLGGKWNEIGALIAKATPQSADTYKCERCTVVVDVLKHGRLYSSGAKQWLCGPCWDLAVLGKPVSQHSTYDMKGNP